MPMSPPDAVRAGYVTLALSPKGVRDMSDAKIEFYLGFKPATSAVLETVASIKSEREIARGKRGYTIQQDMEFDRRMDAARKVTA
jgi:hypothetical protein